MVTDPLALRLAARMAEAEARARGLRAAIPRLARELRRRGARRIVLFGSLASGARPHAGTDIDLCVEGLDQAEVERAELDLSSRDAPLHLVRWESAPPELKDVIERYGVTLAGDDEPA